MLAVSGDTASATLLAGKLLAQQPGNAEVWTLKGDLLQRDPASLLDVAVTYRGALALRPTFLPGQVAVMALLIRQQDPNAADRQRVEMKKALSRAPLCGHPSADAAPVAQRTQQCAMAAAGGPGQTGAGLAGPGRGQPEKGGAPSAVQPRLQLVEVPQRCGQAERALTVLQDLTGIGKPNATALALAGQAPLLRGDAERADIGLSRAVTIKPDDTAVRTARA